MSDKIPDCNPFATRWGLHHGSFEGDHLGDFVIEMTDPRGGIRVRHVPDPSGSPEHEIECIGSTLSGSISILRPEGEDIVYHYIGILLPYDPFSASHHKVLLGTFQVLNSADLTLRTEGGTWVGGDPPPIDPRIADKD